MHAMASEVELRNLRIAGLDGDAAAHKAVLGKLSGRLRAYFKGHLARIGWGPMEAEDPVQELLIAVHVHRDSALASCQLSDNPARKNCSSPFRWNQNGTVPLDVVRHS